MSVLETERLLLRSLAPEDAPFMLRLLNEPSFIENIGDRGVRTLEQAARYIHEGSTKSFQARGHGLYLVQLKSSRAAAGICSLLKREQFQEVDIGYAFLPGFWSQGLARESTAAILDHARNSLALGRVIALVSPGNAASIKLLEKLGFAFSESVLIPPNTAQTSIYRLPD